jgi:hypothetical protein
MTQRDIKVSEENRKNLLQLKLDLGYKNVNELITRLLTIFNRTYKKKGELK